MKLAAVVVAVWGVSVTGQVAALLLGKEWVTPTGINEIGAAVAMWLVATVRAKQAHEDELEDGSDD